MRNALQAVNAARNKCFVSTETSSDTSLLRAQTCAPAVFSPVQGRAVVAYFAGRPHTSRDKKDRRDTVPFLRRDDESQDPRCRKAARPDALPSGSGVLPALHHPYS